jgi:hypothetical protein
MTIGIQLLNITDTLGCDRIELVVSTERPGCFYARVQTPDQKVVQSEIWGTVEMALAELAQKIARMPKAA